MNDLIPNLHTSASESLVVSSHPSQDDNSNESISITFILILQVLSNLYYTISLINVGQYMSSFCCQGFVEFVNKRKCGL